KILATGNGRCNLSNIQTKLANYHGRCREFAAKPLSFFDTQKTLDFFEYLGVTHKVEEDGKVFPHSDQASSVLDVLRYEMEQTGVCITCQAEAVEVVQREGGLQVILSDGTALFADRIVLATGGKAAPQLGSNGSGFFIAQKIGHRIIDPIPALVPLKLEAGFLKRIKGVKFTGRAAVLSETGCIHSEAQGEILFTEYGVSGPPILSLSRIAGEHLFMNREVFLKLTVIDHLSAGELREYLGRRLGTRPDKPLDFSLVGFVNKRLAPVLLQEIGISNIKSPAGGISEHELTKLANILHDWRFRITGNTSWQNAQATAGGIDVSQVDENTMESKILPGLFFAGEVLDIDGDCGGYNLQWAWSSGYLAGTSAAT
ncbi:MAG: NAD(P)/FAD-dependent oxidoreductase, partial [Peptococcaceae bacterium]|nr:NAD(P)/FAD-dependent oxidoreductase [Peptococcaceae bacterium]